MKLLTTFVAAIGISAVALAAEFDPQKIYANSARGVVFVAALSGDNSMAGTGSIISTDGLVLTNAHVVLNKQTGKPADNLWVVLRPDRVTGDQQADLARRYKASAIAYDRDLDLALLRMDQPPATMTVLPFGDPATMDIGQRVVAIGHPEQGGLWSLTTGVISAEFQNFNDVPGKHVFQTEVGLNRGNSGGPLLDGDGRQVGVNTSMARVAKDGMPITSISFSLKSSVAKDWLAKHGVTVAYASAGAAPVAAETLKAGAIVTQPVPEKPKPVVHKQPPAEVPPPRPYNLDETMTRMQKVEKEMTDLMDEMQKQIRGK